MADTPLQVIKTVSALPSSLAPNTFYLVRVGQGYDLYATDTTGSNAYKINVSPSQLGEAIDIAHGGTGATDAETARSNLGLGTAATRNAGYNAEQVPYIKIDSWGRSYLDAMSAGLFRYDYRDSYKPKYITEIGFKFYFTSTGAFFNGVGDYGYCDAVSFSSWHDESGGRFSTLVFNKKAQKIYHGWGGYGGENWQIKTLAYEDGITQNMRVGSIASGQASYAKGWRKLTATLPSQAGEITIAHGVTTIETVQAKVTNSDNITVFNNDIDPASQFYVRVSGANLILGVTANSSKVFGQPVTIYVGEEL